MKQPKHTNANATPGPWTVDDDTNYIRDSRGFVVADLPSCGPNFDTPREANARLIAAAPEMLEALKALLAECYRLNVDIKGASDVMYQCEQIIAKATGGQS